MKRFGVIYAMERELKLVERLAPKGSVIVKRHAGIGKVNAALSTADLLTSEEVDAVISIGCAGSFAEDVRVGDIIIADRVAYHDVWCGEGNEFGQVEGLPKFFETDGAMVADALGIIEGSRRGLVICGDQFYISEAEDRRQKALYPDALAVDMESAAVAQVCHLRGIPFLAIKIISDTHLGGDEKQKKEYAEFWNRHE